MSGSIALDPGSVDDPTKKGKPPLQEQKSPASPTLRAATQGMPDIISSLNDRLAQDRKAVEDATPKMPALQKPPKPDTNNDPFEAFGQPAMWIAALGSLFTRAPLTNALNAAAGVMKGASAKNAEVAKQKYDEWKVETDNAVKLAQFQEKAYDEAIKKFNVDAQAGRAELQVAILAHKDENLQKILDSHGIAGAKAALEDRKKQTHQLQQQVAQTGPYLKAHVDIAAMRASDDPVEQMKGVVAQQEQDLARLQGSKKSTPAQVNQTSDQLNTAKAYLARLQNPDPTVAEPAWAEAKQRFGLSGTGKPPSAAKSTPTASPLSQEAADFAAREWLRTGKMESFGSGGRQEKDQVINAAAKIADASGHSIDDYISGRATLKADTSSLQNITRIRDAAEGYEKGASKELDLAVSLLPKTAEPLNSQILTQWARSGSTQFGDVDVPKYQAALVSALDEYAKVMTGATGAAGSSDASRALALSLIPPGATSEQVPAIVEVLKQGMRNKTSSYDEQIKDIQGRLKGGDTDTQQQPKQTSEPVKLNPETADQDYDALPHGAVFIGPDGQTRRKP